MNKKGIFFTIAAIALTAAIILTYGAYSQQSLNDKMDSIQIRIDTVNFFIKDVENDLEKGINIASFRTLLSFNQYIAGNGTYILDLDEKFKESFLNGTVDGIKVSLMDDSTFTNWTNKMADQAKKIDIVFNSQIDSVTLRQSDPWLVDIELNLTMNIADKKNTSSWSRKNSIVTQISILGFEDPIYTISTDGRVTNQIVRTNISDFVLSGQVDGLLIHTNNSYYIAHNDSPSFLMRLKGDLGSSPQGIESLVNLEKLQIQGIALEDRSIVDYIYFGTGSTVNYRINNTPFWFKIDQEHIQTYGVAGITI